jgi:hypothetical protein
MDTNTPTPSPAAQAAIATLKQHFDAAKADLEAQGETFGKELLAAIESTAIGYLSGAGWSDNVPVPQQLENFQLKNPLLGVTFKCTGGYQNGNLIFTGVPQ